MKRYFLWAVLCCAALCCGCSDDDEENTAGNLEGEWAVVATTDLVDGPIQNERIDQVVVVTNNTFTFYLAKERDWPEEYGYKFLNGYLYDCTMSDFEKQVSFSYEMSGGKLYVMGMEVGMKIENDNRVSIAIDMSSPDDFMVLERVNGWK